MRIRQLSHYPHNPVMRLPAAVCAGFIGVALFHSNGQAADHSKIQPGKDNKPSKSSSPQANKATERTISFPKRSIGGLYVAQVMDNGDWGEGCDKEIAVARGQVTLSVPAGASLILRANSLLVSEPTILLTVAPDAVDCLRISATPLDETDEGTGDKVLSYVGHLTGLKQLELRQFLSTDVGLSSLKSIKHLRHLKSDFGKAEGQCLKDLASLPDLIDLDLSFNPLEQENLKYLPSFPKLQRLILHRCKVGECGVKSIGKCKMINDLSLTDSLKVNDDCIKYLAQLKELQKLDLSFSGVTIKGLAELKGLKKLKRLHVADNLFSSSQLPTLQKMFPNTTIEISVRARPLDKDMNRVLAPMPK